MTSLYCLDIGYYLFGLWHTDLVYLLLLPFLFILLQEEFILKLIEQLALLFLIFLLVDDHLPLIKSRPILEPGHPVLLLYLQAFLYLLPSLLHLHLLHLLLEYLLIMLTLLLGQCLTAPLLRLLLLLPVNILLLSFLNALLGCLFGCLLECFSLQLLLPFKLL